jgi:hypothetical protein
MDTPFPFGFPAASAFYLTAYVVTLALHVVFMNYVLGGSACVAAAALGRGSWKPIGVLKDWLPVVLSGAITAGVAPLLFVQVLYKQSFYTANLLLFHRWMLIVPVLIVGFYAFYLMKSGWLGRRPGWVQGVVTALPFTCIAFVGYSWTENHLLSGRGPAFWAEFYAGDRPVYSEPQLVPRLLVWAFGSVPTTAVLLGWQVWYRGWHEEAVRVSWLALAGFGLTGLAAVTYALVAGEAVRAFVGPMGLPYFVAACTGLVVQAGAWLVIARRKRFDAPALAAASVGLGLTILGMTVCREAVRLETIGWEGFEKLVPVHRAAAAKGGLVVFVLFFVVNAGLIGLCFVLVRRGRLPPTEDRPA